MRGFTLIELIIVVAIIAIFALAGVNTIVAFQRESTIHSVAQEFVSATRLAQTDSIAGRVSTGEVYEDTGYPYYGVTVTPTNFQRIRKYTLLGSGVESSETLETIDIDSTVSISPNAITVMFSRGTGLPGSSQSYTISRTGTTVTKMITIQSNGLITL